MIGWPSSLRKRAAESFCVQVVQEDHSQRLEAVQRVQESRSHRRQHRIRGRVVRVPYTIYVSNLLSFLFRDTVCSVGLISRRLPFVASNSAIRYFRHALSLDERRVKFKANYYNRATAAEQNLGLQKGAMPKSGVSTRPQRDTIWDVLRKWKDPRVEEFVQEAREEATFNSHQSHIEETDVYEVWFAGSHGGKSLPSRVRCQSHFDFDVS